MAPVQSAALDGMSWRPWCGLVDLPGERACATSMRHSSSPAMCHCLCRVLCAHARCSPPPPSALPVPPLTRPHSVSRLCVCLHGHGSLQGTAQTACSALSPAPCSPWPERPHTCWSVIWRACVRCAWLLPRPVSPLRADAGQPRPPRLPACLPAARRRLSPVFPLLRSSLL